MNSRLAKGQITIIESFLWARVKWFMFIKVRDKHEPLLYSGALDRFGQIFGEKNY